MRRRVPTLFAALCLLPLPGAGAQVSTPPATPTTSSVLPTGTAGAPPVIPAHRAEVTYADGQLRIAARNASLNEILHEVGRVTGIQITGGVAEDRVFGTYGPASTSEVMASLLDGTATNILLVDRAAGGTAELILTPRRGAPTPPNPNAVSNNSGYEPPQQPVPPPLQQYGQPYRPQVVTGPPGIGGLPPSNGGQIGTPISGGADLGTTPGAFVPAGQTAPDATAQPGLQPAAQPDPNQPQSPNGVSTPQQIYEQLMRLRQQQQQQQTNP